VEILVYSDGSATVPTKPGGYGYVIVIDGEKLSEGSGHMSGASNNDAELMGAIMGLAEVLKHIIAYPAIYKDPDVTLCSDSQIVLGWASGTYRFKQQNKIDKFKQLQFLVKRLNVKTKWVKGHAGHEHNERCDKLANEARLGIESKPIEKTKETKIGTRKEGIVCLWYGDELKIIDLTSNLVEDYSKDIHGKRGSSIEIRKERFR